MFCNFELKNFCLINYTDDIIYAISSPPGMGAIALIRLSGKGSINLVDSIFSKNIADTKGYTVHFGELKKDHHVLDEVIVNVFRGPNSFTGEDTVEIACHGSIYIQQKILELLAEKGARLALPGEFSKRAFFNGKMDLTQTESIADLIHSESEAEHKIAMQQMKGGISKELNILREKLIEFASLVELELDFSEEDVEFADRSQLEMLIEQITSKVHELSDSFKTGNAIKNGVSVAIVGKPNAGKSSWINVLTDDDVAIVTDIPGTTRDKIEVPIFIEGVKYRLIDTAGLRETDDVVEGIGVKKAKEVIANSSIVMLVLDGATTTSEEVKTQLQEVAELSPEGELLVLVNKKDLMKNTLDLNIFDGVGVLVVSSNDDACRKDVIGLLAEKANIGNSGEKSVVISNLRHFEALKKSEEFLIKVSEGMSNQVSGDFLAMDIRQVLHHLGSITGEISTDDLLGSIFQNFCIGK